MKTEADKNYYYANDDFKQYFIPYDLGYTKKRIGPKYDGVYIIYEELLKIGFSTRDIIDLEYSKSITRNKL